MELVNVKLIQRVVNFTSPPGLRASLAAVLVLILAACSAVPKNPLSIPALKGETSVEVESVDFLAVSDRMHHFVDRVAPAEQSGQQRAWNLSYSILDRFLLPFDYDPGLTLTGPETFRQQTGNCLSFSIMFVAMARSAGLDVWFQEVKVMPQWVNVNETYLVSKHVNAVVKSRGANYVVDVSGTRRNDWLEATRIEDDDAFAQFYNNLGARALLEHDLPSAYAYFRKALELAPETPFMLSNLAVVLNRNGQTDDAKSVYLAALDINPTEETALNNLQRMYFDEGDLVRAEAIRSKVERYRSNNPWYMYRLAMEARDEARYTDAVEYLKRAIRIDGNDYRFYLAMAQTYLLIGDRPSASRYLERARQRAPADIEINPKTLSQLTINAD